MLGAPSPYPLEDSGSTVTLGHLLQLWLFLSPSWAGKVVWIVHWGCRTSATLDTQDQTVRTAFPPVPHSRVRVAERPGGAL